MSGARFMNLRLLRHYHDPHRGLLAIKQATQAAGSVGLLRVPMPIPPVRFGGRSTLIRKIWRYCWLVAGHLDLPRRVYRRKEPTLLIREFLVLPLFSQAPLLWTQRRRCWFLLQHNLQSAHRRRAHRLAFRLLSWAGFRFVVYEDLGTWERCIGHSPRRVRAIPFPVLEKPGRVVPISDTRSIDIPIVGVMGHYRAEKNPEGALSALIAYSSGTGKLFRILLGCPDRDVRVRWENQIETIDTTDSKSYLSALARCTAIVITYQKEFYEYRTSGVIAEALAMGVRVVVPDYPVLRRQIEWPARIGATFARESLIGAAVEEVLMIPPEQWQAARKLHLERRGVTALSVELKKWQDDLTKY